MPIPRRVRVGLLLPLLAPSLPAQAPATEPTPLEDLEVTVLRTPLLLTGAGMAITVLEGRVARRGRRFVGPAEAFAFVPGVVARERGDRALEPRLAIRGAGARANFGVRGLQVIVDGVPATLADGQAPLTFLDLDLAERIEVARGPLAALHGNGAQGVIAIATAARPTGPWEGRLAWGGGSRGVLDLLATAGVAGERIGGFLAASRRSTAGVRRHAEARQLRVRGALEWRAGRGTRFTLRGSLADDPLLQAPGALTAAEFATDPAGANPAAIARQASKRVEQGQFSVGFRHEGGTAATEVTAWLLQRDLFNPLAVQPAGATDPLDGLLIEVDRAVAGLRAASTRTIGSRVVLTAGIDVQRQDDWRRNSVHRAGAALAGTDLLDQRQLVTALGPFAQAVVALEDGVSLRGGMRHDRVAFDIADRRSTAGSGRRTMAAWSAGATLTRRRGPFASWIGIATAFETPTTTELAGRPDGMTGINDLLDPSRSLNLEVGLRVRQLGGEFEVVLWRATTRDAITPVEAMDGRSWYDNVGRTRTRGLELALATRLRDGWRAQLSATFLDARFGATAVADDGTSLEGGRLPGIPRNTARVGIAGAIGPLRVDLDHGWSSGLDADDRNTIGVAGWGAGITNLAVQWPVSQATTIFASADNILDRAHVASVVVNGFGGRVIEPGNGRLLAIGAEIRLAPR